MTASSPGNDGATVLVADDHPITLAGLRTLLERQPWVGAVHATASTQEARATALQEKPALALLDLKIPSSDVGIALNQWTRKALPTCRILVLTMFGEPLARRGISDTAM